MGSFFPTLQQRFAGVVAGSRRFLNRPLRAAGDGCAPARPALSDCAAVRRTLRSLCLSSTAAGLFLTAAAFPALAAPPSGTPIVNSAWISADDALLAQDSVSVTFVERTAATLTLSVYQPTSTLAAPVVVEPTEYHPAGTPPGTYALLPSPVYKGATLPLGGPLPLVSTSDLLLHAGEPLFISLGDEDQNLDPLAVEKILVTVTSSTGDSEILRLTETGANTGLFCGVLITAAASAVSGDGTLQVAVNGSVEGRYLDIADGGDSSSMAALVDPLGVVFDSVTGSPVDGATVSLYRLADLSDTVGVLASGHAFADDGVTPFPATVTSGDSAYGFPAGGFRYPMIDPGFYRLEVVPPAGYRFPSTLTIPAALSYVVVVGSRGEPFQVNPGPALHIDMPVDPLDGGLWLSKEVNRALASVGDFLQYRLTLENNNTATDLAQVVIEDRLPAGFRYRQGSARRDGARIDDPQIASDGRLLTFAVGDLAAATRVELSYVVEITAGAPTGPATNQAQAVAAGNTRSNVAAAVVAVREAFLRNSTILVGRVSAGSCGDVGEGLADVRIYQEDGSYVLTDTQGRYHFEGMRPGTHVVQLDLDSLPPEYEVVPCEANSHFAGRSFSRFVDLQPGTLWQADFHVALRPAPIGEARLELHSAVDDGPVLYAVALSGGTVPLSDRVLTIELPEGIDYLPDSSQLDGAPVADPERDGATLRYPLGGAAAVDWRQELIFRSSLPTATENRDLTTTATLHAMTPKGAVETPPARTILRQSAEDRVTRLAPILLRPQFPTFSADLGSKDKAELDKLAATLVELRISRIIVSGHTDSVPIAKHNHERYANNFNLSEARAKSVVRYLSKVLHLTPAQVTLYGMGDTVPIASNATAEGRETNRRVLLVVEAERVEHHTALENVAPHSGPQMVATTGMRPGEEQDAAPAPAAIEPTPEASGILAPAAGSRLADRISGVRILLDSLLKPLLLLDGVEIPADRVGFRREDPKTGKTLYSYIGVDFGDEGEHLLELRGLDPFGNSRAQYQAKVFRTGEITLMRIFEEGENIADGKTPIRVRLQLIDAAGETISAPTTLELVDGDLRPYEDQSIRDTKAQAEVPERRNLVEVDSDGWARFAPTQTSGRYHATLRYNEATVEVVTTVKPQMRDWILVGVAEGTVGFNTLSGNMENLPADAADEGLYESERLAFFAKGQIKGEWLLTLAYDSDKPSGDGRSLYQTIDPDSYYTLYGDATQQGYDAASARKLFVKLEREQFVALFGDYDTGLTVTELSRYSRSLSGIKVDWQGRRGELRAFASDTGQNFIKDELRGDGTSGLYRLSKRDIVLNSEKVTIEVRDRFHSERVLEARSLVRHLDYEIDYDAATFFFKEPVMTRDAGFNPVWIVVDYEVDGGSGQNWTYGGRGAVNVPGAPLQIGASAIHEDQGANQGSLYGLDAEYRLGIATTLRGEVATSRVEDTAGDVGGNAYLAELRHQGIYLDGRVYYREEGDGFGLGQLPGSENGTRKFGFDGSYRLSPIWRVGGEAFRERILSSGAERTVGEATAQYQKPALSSHFGLRQAVDSHPGVADSTSTQALAGVSWKPGRGRWTLRADHEQSLGGSNDSADYPTRTLLGTDYRLTERTQLFAEQEFTTGEQRSNSTRAGVKTSPWKGSTLTSAVGRQAEGGSERAFALLGLQQTLQLTEHWSVDGTLDRSQTIHEVTPVNPAAPPASGDGIDYTAVTVGATFKVADWSWWNRLEYRTSDSDDKWGASSGLYGQLREDLGITTRLQAFLSESPDGTRNDSGDLRFGVAWRPLHSRWILLDRLDLLGDRQSSATFDLRGWRLVNNLNLNCRIGRRAQLSLQYGAKYVLETIDESRYTGYTDLIGIEGRYDLSDRWDLGVYNSVLHSWKGGEYQYRLGGSVGCQVVTNAWVSLGYNLLGFTDPDFSAAEYTAQGPFLRLRFKFDQNSVKDALKWLDRS